MRRAGFVSVLSCAALNSPPNQMYTESLCAEQPVPAGVWMSAGNHRALSPKLFTNQHRPAGAASRATTFGAMPGLSQQTRSAFIPQGLPRVHLVPIHSIQFKGRQMSVQLGGPHLSEGRNKCRTGNGWRARRTAVKRLECLPS